MKKEPRGGTKEALRQLLTGNDFEPPERMLTDLTPEQAAATPEGFPYSVAGQVGHMAFWQRRWLGRINDQPLERQKGQNGDWPRVPAEEWESARDAFLAGLKEAASQSEDPAELSRRLENGDTIDALLLMLALHSAYHLGQIALIRQTLGLWPPQGGDDVW